MIRKFVKYIAMAITISSVSICLSGCKSNVETIDDYLSNDKYVKAVKKADSLTKDEDIAKANDLIKNKIEEIKNEYIEGEIDGALAISDIEKLRSKNQEINDSVNSVNGEIHMRMNSKKAFDDGVKFENDTDYKMALQSYHLVKEDDTDNYEEAQSRISNLKEKLKNNEILSVNEGKVIVTSRTHKDLYPDQLQIILKNNGNSNIRKFEITIFGYDENNNPVKIKNKESESEAYPFLGLADNISINSGDTWGYEYGWSVLNDNIRKIEGCIEYVEYEDGSTWENPLYMEWLKDHWIDE